MFGPIDLIRVLLLLSHQHYHWIYLLGIVCLWWETSGRDTPIVFKNQPTSELVGKWCAHTPALKTDHFSFSMFLFFYVQLQSMCTTINLCERCMKPGQIDLMTSVSFRCFWWILTINFFSRGTHETSTLSFMYIEMACIWYNKRYQTSNQPNTHEPFIGHRNTWAQVIVIASQLNDCNVCPFFGSVFAATAAVVVLFHRVLRFVVFGGRGIDRPWE